MSSDDVDIDKTNRMSNFDEDTSARTRTRVSRACTRCRSRKDKCDGRRPSCSTCISAHQVCTYEPSTKKRGLPEGYVRGLEKLWALLIHKIGGLEETVGQILQDDQQELLQAWNHTDTGEELHSIWKESRILHELETLLAGLDHTQNAGLKRKRDRTNKDDEEESSDESPGLTSLLRQQYSVNVAVTDGVAGGRKEPYHRNATVGGTSTTTSRELNLPKSSSNLLNLYSTYTHCWFPILDRPHILRKCYEYKKPGATLGKDSSDLGLLWAIFAYVTQQSGNGTQPPPGLEAEMTVEEMRSRSRELIPTESGSFTLQHVQSLLILALLDIGLGSWARAWIIVGQAIRITQELCWDQLPGDKTKRSLGVLQACFILDTLVALRLRYPPHLRRADIERYGFMDEDGHEEWEPWNASTQGDHREPAFTISCYNRLTELFMVLNDCITFTGGHKEVRRAYFEEKLDTLANLKSTYPMPFATDAQRPPHHTFLHLCHLATFCLVLRQAGLNHISVEILPHNIHQFLDVASKCITSRTVGLRAMPPLLAGFFILLEQVIDDTTSEPQGSLRWPAFNSLREGLGRIALRAAEIWPVYKSMATKLTPVEAPTRPVPIQPAVHEANGSAKKRPRTQTQTQTQTQDSSKVLQTQMQPQLQPQPQSQQQHSTTLSRNSLWPLDPFAMQDDQALRGLNVSSLSAPLLSSSSVQPWQQSTPPIPTHQRASDAMSLATVSSNFETPTATTSERIDLPMVGMDQTVTSRVRLSSETTSPSFHGDEIDALFHEMAHLDTTEWTNGRSQGLKEFGFTDDMTFEAFCNDPDRLVSSDNFTPGELMSAAADEPRSWMSPDTSNRPPSAVIPAFEYLDTGWA